MPAAEVEVVESSMVRPGEETPKHDLWLSNLDVSLRPTFTPTLYYYHRPTAGADGFFLQETLKAALSKVLILFYPLAGRLVVGGDGREVIRCTGDGALFTVARCSVMLAELGEEAVPSPETREMLVPKSASGAPPCGLLMFQLTFFRCGGASLGAAIHHTAVDGISAIHFLKSWAEASRGSHISLPPFLDRSLLRARSPPRHAGLKLFAPPPVVAPEDCKTFTSPDGHPEHSVLSLSEHQVAALKNRFADAGRLSTFKVVAGHVWQCMCLARCLRDDEETRVFIAADVRRRLVPPLPPGYMGNAFLKVQVSAAAGEVLAGSGGARRISDVLGGLSDEHLRSVIDFLEVQGDMKGSAPGDWGERGGRMRGSFWITSWLGMPLYAADFGWGPPAFMVRATTRLMGKAYIVPAPSAGDGVSVVVGFEPPYMARFKSAFYQMH